MTDTPIKRAFDEALANGTAFVDPKDGVIRSCSGNAWNAPLVYDEASGELTVRTRITTYIKVLDVFSGGLDKYKQAQVLLGVVNELAVNPNALDRAIEHLAGRSYDEIKEDRQAKGVMYGQVSDFENSGGSHRKAWWGDMIHALTQAYEESARTFTAAQTVEAAWDRVEELYIEKMATTRVTLDPAKLHERLEYQVQLYIDAMKDVEVIECEQRVDVPELGSFGTPDRLCRVDGLVFHADVKTGGNDGVEEQMAVATLGEPYDYTHGLQPRPAELRPSREVAMLIDMPGPGPDWMGARGNPEYVLTWLDIRQAAKKVAEVIPLTLQARSGIKNRRPFVPGELPDFVTPPAKPTRKRAAKKTAPATATTEEVLLGQIEKVNVEGDLITLWRTHKESWTDRLTEAAALRKSQIRARLDEAGTKPQAA